MNVVLPSYQHNNAFVDMHVYSSYSPCIAKSITILEMARVVLLQITVFIYYQAMFVVRMLVC